MAQGPAALQVMADELGLAVSSAVLALAVERLASLELQRAQWMLQGLDPGLEPFKLLRGDPATTAARVLGLSWVLGVCVQGEASLRVSLLERMPSGRALLGAIRPLGPVQESVMPQLPGLRAAWTPILGETLAQGEVLLPKVIASLEAHQPSVGPHSFASLGERFVQELALRQAADPVSSLAPSAPLTPPPELTLSSTEGLPLGPPSDAAPLPGAPPPKLRPFPMPEEPFVPSEDAHWPPAEDALPEAAPAPEPEGPPPLSGPPGQARQRPLAAPSGARALPLVAVGLILALVLVLLLIIAVALGAALFTL